MHLLGVSSYVRKIRGMHRRKRGVVGYDVQRGRNGDMEDPYTKQVCSDVCDANWSRAELDLVPQGCARCTEAKPSIALVMESSQGLADVQVASESQSLGIGN